jgi:hypothetical protein
VDADAVPGQRIGERSRQVMEKAKVANASGHGSSL